MQIVSGRYRLYRVLFALVLLIAVIIAYHNTLQSPFLFDDGPNIINNPYIQIDDLGVESLKKVFSTYQPSRTRPLANLSLALNYLVDGYDPVGFHLVNIIIHLLCAWMVFHLFHFYLHMTDFSEGDSLIIAAVAALLWALNPLQTNAVTYIIQRMTSLSTLFFCASLLVYVKARELQLSDGKQITAGALAGFFMLAVIFWLLAMMSKEIAAIMPVVILLHELFFFRKGSKSSAGISRYVWWAALFLALLLWLFLGIDFWHSIMAGYAARDFTPVQRLLTESRVVVHYLSLFLLPFPSRMTLCYDFPLSRSLFDPLSTFFSIIFILSMISLAWSWAKRYRLLSFGILWTFSCLLIESTIIPLELIFEHRFYLPSIGFSLALVVAVFYLVKYFTGNRFFFNLFWVLCLSFMVTMTYMRNRDWQSELSIHLDGVAKTPELVRAVNNLAGVYVKVGEYVKGQATLERALRLDPDNVVVLANLYILFSDLEMAVPAEFYLGRLIQAISDGHFRCNQSTNLLLAAEVLVTKGRFAEAINLLESLAPCRAKSAVYYDNLALCYARVGNLTKAIENFKAALEREPLNPYYRYSLIRSYMKQGEIDSVLRELKVLRNTEIPAAMEPHLEKLERYLQGKL